jgi:alpha-beta hydrolase superfamily lysophospholipase
MLRLAWRWGRRLLIALFAVVGVIVAVRAVQAMLAVPLEPWHSVVPAEAKTAALDRMDWPGWLDAERAAFAEVAAKVDAVVAARPEDRANRYDPRSPMHRAGFGTDWNRSFMLAPEGAVRGAAVLVHGLTDAPYSMRHLAELYRARGFIAIAPRMPGHGTVPGGLTAAYWEQWAAAVRLAMREARRRAGPDAPVHLVGYSNGGALALLHALDALGDPALVRPARVVLLSPMIGVSPFARFAGIAGLPALLPAFASAAWLGVQPEFNPFKYNSFPVNAGRQSFQLTQAVQARLDAAAAAGRLAALPPVLTFQSLADSTVSTPAVVQRLYARLPAQGSELVILDRNRAAVLDTLVRQGFRDPAADLAPAAPRSWALTIVTNADAHSLDAVALHTPAGATLAARQPIGARFPDEVYSLSHVALPFPREDSLYGGDPQPLRQFGVSLGALAPRGETGVLRVPVDGLMRLTWNPFHALMLERIAAGIP